MYYALVVLEIVLAVVLIVLILLQPHEGEGMGAVFGGSSGVETFLGTKTITVLWKTTVTLGCVFILIAILLNLIPHPTAASGGEKRKNPPPAKKKAPGKSGSGTNPDAGGAGSGLPGGGPGGDGAPTDGS